MGEVKNSKIILFNLKNYSLVYVQRFTDLKFEYEQNIVDLKKIITNNAKRNELRYKNRWRVSDFLRTSSNSPVKSSQFLHKPNIIYLNSLKLWPRIKRNKTRTSIMLDMINPCAHTCKYILIVIITFYVLFKVWKLYRN